MSMIHLRWALDEPDDVPKRGCKMVLYKSDAGLLTFTTDHEVNKQGDHFKNHGMALLETTTLQSIDYGKPFPSHEREKYAKALAEFNNTFQDRQLNRHAAIPTTFLDPICPKKVHFTKKKWRRSHTNYEAAQAQKADQRQHRRAKSIELARTQKMRL